MESFYKYTKNPMTDQWEEALWVQGYFGPNNFGVKFSDGTIYNPAEVTLKTRAARELV